MAGLLFGSASAASKPSSFLRVQTSLQGQPIPLLLGGRNRLACNIIDYTDFQATPQSSGGGKGALLGGKSSGSYKYSAAIIAAICEGPVASIDAVWNNKTKEALSDLDLTAYLGGYTQTAWGYMTSKHPDRALAYRGICYVAAGPLQLGQSAELPNLNFEVTSTIANAIPNAPDASPADCIVSFLTNAKFGLGFPSGLIGDLTQYSAACLASGMVVSPVLGSQDAAGTFLNDLLTATNANARWSSGVLDILPYGDQYLSANGATYTPDLTPVYALDADAFVPDTNGQAITITRSPQSEQFNQVSIQYLDRYAAPDPDTGDSHAYDPAIVMATDDASVQLFGLRTATQADYPFFCMASAAQMSASLLLGRQQVRNTYSFTLTHRFIRLDPMDIVTLTDPLTGLSAYPVRITEIQENADHSLAVTAEDLLLGTASSPLYGSQPNAGQIPNYALDPGNVNPPILFEPPYALGGGYALWAAVSGADLAVWGGSDVYASYDGETYAKVGTIYGAARTGSLTAELPAVTQATSGATIDDTNTLSVDLSESAGTLISGTETDARAFNTLMWADGELLAYATATLTGANAYDLTYLARGAYGSIIGDHAEGARVARVDDALLKVPFTSDRIGARVYFKFVSFNIWNAGYQNIADVEAYPPGGYVIQGTGAPPPVTVSQANLDAGLNAAIQQVLSGIPADMLIVRQMVEDLAAATASQITTITERLGQINIGVGARYQQNQATAELALTASATDRAVLAAIFGESFATTDAGTADALLRIIAASSLDTGDLALVQFAVQAGFGGQLASAALELAAVYTDALGLHSRIRLQADQVDFIVNGVTLPAASLVVSNAPHVIPDISGTVRADLSDHETQFATTLSEDVTMQFPIGGWLGYEWSHTFTQDNAGGHAVNVDPTVFISGAPAILSNAGYTSEVRCRITNLNPPQATALFLSGGNTQFGLDSTSFSIYPPVNGFSTWDVATDGPLVGNVPGTYVVTPRGADLQVQIEVWGPGGSSGTLGAQTALDGHSGTADGQVGAPSTFQGMTANPGAPSSGVNSNVGPIGGDQFAGGTASGGDTNETGSPGGRSQSNYPQNNYGGAAAGTGGGAATANNSDVTSPQYSNGIPGNGPGGGASGILWYNGKTNGLAVSSGGGGGGKATKRFTAGVLLSGEGYTLVVGDSGAAGIGDSSSPLRNGGKGAPGGFRISA